MLKALLKYFTVFILISVTVKLKAFGYCLFNEEKIESCHIVKFSWKIRR